jgi:hypothetical protein
MFLLEKYHREEDLREMNGSFTIDVLKTIGTTLDRRGQRNNVEFIKNKGLKDELKMFYDDEFY